MSVIFSDHAKLQLKKRSISQKRVLETVKNKEEVRPSFKKRKLLQKVYGGKILEVVTITEGSMITVITAYYLKEENEN